MCQHISRHLKTGSSRHNAVNFGIVSMPADTDPRRWRMLALLAVAELLGMSLWFAGSAVSLQLGALWSLSTSQIAWLTAIVQLGFVVGTALSAILNIADIVESRKLFAISAIAGAIANAGLLVAPGFAAVIVARFLTGFFLAGVYPPAMKMVATWFRAERGLAIGTIVGALTVGKATPYLIHAIPDVGVAPVILAASAGAVIAGLLVATGYHDGPHRFTSRPFSWSLVATVASAREWRLATGGYLGHMFELYAFWTWIPAFLAASVASAGYEGEREGLLSLIVFLAIAAGGAGSIWGGLYADRRGRERLVIISLAASGLCSLGVGFFFGGAVWALAAIAIVWGFFVVADSAQFSALVTESVPGHAVGTALTIQTSIGFLLTMITIQAVPLVAARIGWQWVFAMLAMGPAAGIASIRALQRYRLSTR